MPLLQAGNSNKNESPSNGENAPNKYVDLKTCWNGHIGFTPFAVNAFPFIVNKPNLLSSWKYKLKAWYFKSLEMITS